VSASSVVVLSPDSSTVEQVQQIAPSGLTSNEARVRLEKDGPNAMPDTSAHPLRNALAKFWAPVPWLLEASIVLEIVLHKYYEAAVIAALLVFNAALAYFQESRAQATVAALKSRLALNASVQRDGEWKIAPKHVACTVFGGRRSYNLNARAIRNRNGAITRRSRRL
jgi:H+-transporting ATPase